MLLKLAAQPALAPDVEQIQQGTDNNRPACIRQPRHVHINQENRAGREKEDVHLEVKNALFPCFRGGD